MLETSSCGHIENAAEENAFFRALRSKIAGTDQEVPLRNGERRPYVNFDNAATTPPFHEVLEAVNRFATWYSSVHRGTGYKSQLSTEIYEQCRAIAARFAGADPDERAVIFCGNTTQAINILARRLELKPGERVLATMMEHHSNMLPWRLLGHPVEYVAVCDADGTLSLDDFERCLSSGGVRLVVVTGASNVTGCMPPLAKIATLAHAHGAQLLVDGAQLIPHRKVDMGQLGQPESIDFLAFSAHKMYAPMGSGVLIGPREFFQQGPPAMPGGGTVRIVTMKEIIWADAPEVEEAGTPNLMGAVALAKSIQVLESIGMDRIAQHERMMTRHLLEGLGELPGVRLYGQTKPTPGCDRVGVVPLVLDGMEHGEVASVLSYEYGIGVRHGCFCAHPYVMQLNHITLDGAKQYTDKARQGDFRHMPGFVRISLGLYNTVEEIDYLIDSLRQLQNAGPRGKYLLDSSGEYFPEGAPYDFAESFRI